jgi:hypothetical protein
MGKFTFSELMLFVMALALVAIFLWGINILD